MNLYAQYLALLQMFFHNQHTRTPRQEKQFNDTAVKEEELFRNAA